MVLPGFTLHIRPQGWSVTVRADQTLLGAALAAGLRPPYSCTLGYCGVCRARLVSGVVEYPSGRRVESSAHGATPDEIMLCIARPRSDVEVELCFASQPLPANASVASRKA